MGAQDIQYIECRRVCGSRISASKTDAALVGVHPANWSQEEAYADPEPNSNAGLVDGSIEMRFEFFYDAESEGRTGL